MKVSYDRLWKLMIDKKINKTQLKDLAGINSNCIAKMGKDEPVHMEILIKICEALNCEFNDIVEIKENKEE
jgi:DNA (cytosine-5)-methyltransferase 1